MCIGVLTVYLYLYRVVGLRYRRIQARQGGLSSSISLYLGVLRRYHSFQTRRPAREMVEEVLIHERKVRSFAKNTLASIGIFVRSVTARLQKRFTTPEFPNTIIIVNSQRFVSYIRTGKKSASHQIMADSPSSRTSRSSKVTGCSLGMPFISANLAIYVKIHIHFLKRSTCACIGRDGHISKHLHGT